MNLDSYISGFGDGEGCFCVSFQPSKRYRFGWEVRPSFSVKPERGQSRTALRDSGGVGMRVHTTGQVRQDAQVRGAERERFGGEGAAAFQSVSAGVVEAGRL